MREASVEHVAQVAHVALRSSSIESRAPLVVLGADRVLFEALDQQVHDATAELATLVSKTAAGVLLRIPGVGVLTTSRSRGGYR